MPSPMAETKCEVVEAVADDVEPNGRSPNESAGSRSIRRRRKRRSSYLPKFACLRTGRLDTEVAEVGRKRPNPAHLVIMVNGLIGRSGRFRFQVSYSVNFRWCGWICVITCARILAAVRRIGDLPRSSSSRGTRKISSFTVSLHSRDSWAHTACLNHNADKVILLKFDTSRVRDCL